MYAAIKSVKTPEVVSPNDYAIFHLHQCRKIPATLGDFLNLIWQVLAITNILIDVQ